MIKDQMQATLYHGDCLEEMGKIADGSVDLVLTDPPYGTTACKWDSIIPLEPMWAHLKRIAKQKAAIVMTASQPFTSVLITSNLNDYKYSWAWDKKQGTGFLNSKCQPLRQVEDVCVFYRKQTAYNPQMRTGFKPYSQKQGLKKTENYGKQTGALTVSDGSRFPINLLQFSRDKSRVHPTQKPVALMEYLIKTYTNEGDTVLDFTMGSGSTGVACMNTGRKFIGIERDGKYFAIAENRIADAQHDLLNAAQGETP